MKLSIIWWTKEKAVSKMEDADEVLLKVDFENDPVIKESESKAFPLDGYSILCRLDEGVSEMKILNRGCEAPFDLSAKEEDQVRSFLSFSIGSRDNKVRTPDYWQPMFSSRGNIVGYPGTDIPSFVVWKSKDALLEQYPLCTPVGFYNGNIESPTFMDEDVDDFTYYCDNCGGTNVAEATWIDMNTKVERSPDSVGTKWCFDCNEMVDTTTERVAYSNAKRRAVEVILTDIWARIGIDPPHNSEDIAQLCYVDVCEAADPEHWSSEDVAIAFRRWIESVEVPDNNQ